MDKQNGSSSNPTHASGATEPRPAQRTLLPAGLFRAAVKGSNQVWTDKEDHLVVNIEASEAAASSQMKKEALDNLRSATYMGNTVLHVLASYGHTKLISLLREKYGPLWRAQNKMFETPFHCAAKGGHKDTISALIDFGRNVGEDQLKAALRERNKRGETALHEAARRGHEDVVFKLMEVDRLLALELNNNGISPLSLAAARGTHDDTETVKKILQQLKEQNTDSAHSIAALENTVRGTNQEVMITMPKSDVEISKDMPIHFLATAGGVDMIRLLLENDKSLAYLQDSDGSYPVHLAARMGNSRIVALFMEIYFFHVAAEENMSKVFTDLMDKYSETPIENMKEMFTKMILEIDNECNTPSHLAKAKGCRFVMNAISDIMKECKSVVKVDILTSSESAKISKNMMDKLQLIGLGAVLITTVAFVVAFTTRRIRFQWLAIASAEICF